MSRVPALGIVSILCSEKRLTPSLQESENVKKHYSFELTSQPVKEFTVDDLHRAIGEALADVPEAEARAYVERLPADHTPDRDWG